MIQQAPFPGADWHTGTPESQGFRGADLDGAARYASGHGGGSGCVVRHGVLVKEWGDRAMLADIKSAAKGTAGATLLGLAVDAGLVALDDRARLHYPALGTPGQAANPWLNEITVRHLATMTAGFDDGRPPALVYRPGTRGIYSNDTANMLAELLTIKFEQDLRVVLQQRVMDHIGVTAKDWTWRANQYRAKVINGLPTREFASGIRITHRALARIGYLYLRGGQWNGRPIVSAAFVREAAQPTALPAPYDYYGFYWGTNGRGQFPGMPRDTFWALGLGDSFVAVSPSLDLVVVRLGIGSAASKLAEPGGTTDNWGRRVEGLVRQIAGAIR